MGEQELEGVAGGRAGHTGNPIPECAPTWARTQCVPR